MFSEMICFGPKHPPESSTLTLLFSADLYIHKAALFGLGQRVKPWTKSMVKSMVNHRCVHCKKKSPSWTKTQHWPGLVITHCQQIEHPHNYSLVLNSDNGTLRWMSRVNKRDRNSMEDGLSKLSSATASLVDGLENHWSHYESLCICSQGWTESFLINLRGYQYSTGLY